MSFRSSPHLFRPTQQSHMSPNTTLDSSHSSHDPLSPATPLWASHHKWQLHTSVSAIYLSVWCLCQITPTCNLPYQCLSLQLMLLLATDLLTASYMDDFRNFIAGRCGRFFNLLQRHGYSLLLCLHPNIGPTWPVSLCCPVLYPFVHLLDSPFKTGWVSSPHL